MTKNIRTSVAVAAIFASASNPPPIWRPIKKKKAKPSQAKRAEVKRQRKQRQIQARAKGVADD